MALKTITQRTLWALTASCLLAGGPAWAYEPQNAEEAIRFGDQAFFYRNYEKARQFYQFACQEEPAQAYPAVRLGLLDYAQGYYALARQEFQKANGLKKDFRTADFIKTALAKMDSARETLDALEIAGIRGEVSALQIKLHQEAAKRISAGKVYMGIVWPHLDYLAQRDPRNVKILYWLANGFFDSSDSRRAAYYYKKVAALNSHDRQLYHRLADVSVNTGAYDDAGLYYRRALREATGDGSKKDIRDFKKLIRALPQPTSRILILLKNEEYDAAFKQLKKCLALNPSDPWAMTLLGTIYEEINQDWQAERLYEKVVKRFPEFPPGHFYLGRFYLFKKKRFEDAAEALERFRESLAESLEWIENPVRRQAEEKDLVQATRYIAYIYGEVMKQPAKALAVLEPFAATHPKEAGIFYDEGCAYLELKKRVSAYQAFKKVITLDPGSALAKDAANAIEYIQKSPDYGRYTGPYD